jgi:hypothetical protein
MTLKFTTLNSNEATVVALRLMKALSKISKQSLKQNLSCKTHRGGRTINKKAIEISGKARPNAWRFRPRKLNLDNPKSIVKPSG